MKKSKYSYWSDLTLRYNRSEHYTTCASDAAIKLHAVRTYIYYKGTNKNKIGNERALYAYVDKNEDVIYISSFYVKYKYVPVIGDYIILKKYMRERLI